MDLGRSDHNTIFLRLEGIKARGDIRWEHDTL